MTDKELLYIKTIVDEGSISKAARKLYVTQPSLSHCVQHAEEVLDTRLFIRSPSGLTLTYAGEKYYRFATQVLHLYNDLRMEISEISQLKKGRITSAGRSSWARSSCRGSCRSSSGSIPTSRSSFRR